MQVRMNTFFLQSFRGLRGIKKQVVNLGTANLRSKTVGVDTVVEGGSVGVAGGGGEPGKTYSLIQEFLKITPTPF